MTGIPVMVHLDRETFLALEGRAKREGTTIRAILTFAARRQAGTVAAPAGTSPKRRRVSATIVDEWVMLVLNEGIANGEIARRYGVSDALVSRRLIERGIRRKRAHLEAIG